MCNSASYVEQESNSARCGILDVAEGGLKRCEISTCATAVVVTGNESTNSLASPSCDVMFRLHDELAG